MPITDQIDRKANPKRPTIIIAITRRVIKRLEKQNQK